MLEALSRNIWSGVGGNSVPQEIVSPRTLFPRIKCPPGRNFLGNCVNVAYQLRVGGMATFMSEVPKARRHLASMHYGTPVPVAGS